MTSRSMDPTAAWPIQTDSVWAADRPAIISSSASIAALAVSRTCASFSIMHLRCSATEIKVRRWAKRGSPLRDLVLQ
jgi:hypothetical protein